MLNKLQAKLEELEATQPSCSEDRYRPENGLSAEEWEVCMQALFKEYEANRDKHQYSIECIKKAIKKMEEATMIRHAMDLINE